MAKKNLLYAQSGGVTPVINATACGLIETARAHRDTLGKVYAGKNGIIGILNEELIDRIVEQSDEQAAGRTVMQLENERDRNLVALLKALRDEDAAAGAFLNEVNRRHQGEG